MYYCKVGDTFAEPPQPRPEAVFATLKSIRRKILRAYGTRPSPVSPEQFVEMYKGRRRVRYEQAMETFYDRGVKREDSESIAFVKLGKVKPSSAARGIQPRKPVYNLAIGRYIKPIEKKLYRAIQRAAGSRTPVVMKGFNVVEVALIIHAKWSEFSDPVAIGLDATKFDMHVSHAVLLWEHSVYNELYSDADLAEWLSWQLNNKGSAYAFDGKLKYKVKGRRFSGDMNTALGNCLIMCALVYAYAEHVGVKIELVNNGDDCVVIMERQYQSTFMTGLNAWFLEMGFRMTSEAAVDTFELIEFCQMHPVCVAGQWRMVRNFNSAREKDSMALLNISQSTTYGKWLGAVGECGLALASGVPVVQEYYSALMRRGVKSNIGNSLQMQSGANFLRIGMEAKFETVDASTRVSFYKAFDVTPDEQVALEQYYKALDLRFGGCEYVDNLTDINTSPF